MKVFDAPSAGRCLHCREWVTARSSAEWRRVVWSACPHCGRIGW